MKPVTTKVHGVLDYATGATLVTLPSVLGVGGMSAGRALRGAGLGHVAYSLLTNYELGVKRVLPMPAHLTLDALSGALLCAAPALLPEEDGVVAAALVGFGAFELGAALATKTEPPALAA